MSSATSTDASSFRPWHFFVLSALTAATVGVFLIRDTAPSSLILVSLAIMSAALAGMALYRTLVPFATDAAFEVQETMSGRTRAALEREKALVLRSIKELEFDRAMGKLSDADFEDMAGRLRARAMGLIKQLDETGEGFRELIEREIHSRLASRKVSEPLRPLDPPAARRAPPAEDGPQAFGGVTPAVAAKSSAGDARRACSGCGTSNDADARFCKSCGRPI
jgi:hypothetical protein